MARRYREASRDAFRALGQDEVDELWRLPDDVPRLLAPGVLLFQKEVGERIGEHTSARRLLRPLQRRTEGRWSCLGDDQEVLAHAVLNDGSSVAIFATSGCGVAPDGRVPAMGAPRDVA